MPYLRHKTTGEIYPMNEHLMRRGDFEAIESLPGAEPAPVVDEAVAPKKPRKKKEAVVEEVPAEDDPLAGEPPFDLDDLSDLE